MSEIDIVCVATTANRALAHDWRESLEAEGIACEVGEQLDFWFDNVPASQADVWVHRNDAHRAREIIDLTWNPAPLRTQRVQLA
jgi:hypothetical protein